MEGGGVRNEDIHGGCGNEGGQCGGGRRRRARDTREDLLFLLLLVSSLIIRSLFLRAMASCRSSLPPLLLLLVSYLHSTLLLSLNIGWPYFFSFLPSSLLLLGGPMEIYDLLVFIRVRRNSSPFLPVVIAKSPYYFTYEL